MSNGIVIFIGSGFARQLVKIFANRTPVFH